MARMRLLTALLACLVVSLFLKMAFTSSGPTRQPGPDLALPLKQGAPPTRLADMKGKVVILDFWATWCGPCRMSIPELEDVYKKYHGQGLEVVGISEDEQHSGVPDTVKDLGMTYPIVFATDVPGIHDKFTHTGIPAMYIYDKKGMLVSKQEGYDPQGHLDAKIVDLLKE